jgi:hypothetical protein
MEEMVSGVVRSTPDSALARCATHRAIGQQPGRICQADRRYGVTGCLGGDAFTAFSSGLMVCVGAMLTDSIGPSSLKEND